MLNIPPSANFFKIGGCWLEQQQHRMDLDPQLAPSTSVDIPEGSRQRSEEAQCATNDENQRIVDEFVYMDSCYNIMFLDSKCHLEPWCYMICFWYVLHSAILLYPPLHATCISKLWIFGVYMFGFISISVCACVCTYSCTSIYIKICIFYKGGRGRL